MPATRPLPSSTLHLQKFDHVRSLRLVPEVVREDDTSAHRPKSPAPTLVSDHIDCDGVHRVRSSWLIGANGGRYQLVVMRAGEKVTVYRRFCGSTEAVRVRGHYTSEEMAALSLALEAIETARSPRH